MPNTNTYRFIFTTIVLFALSAIGFANINPSISFPFEVINGLTIIEAEIDGQSGRFLLDTGSDGVFIDGKVEQANHSVLTLGGEAKISTKSLGELKVGAYMHNDIEAQIISLSPIEDHLGIDLNGIIGGHLFLPKIVIMDFKNSLITLSDKLTKYEKQNFEHRVAIQIVNQVPVAKIRIEEQTFNFALDSGSSIHFIDSKLVKSLQGVKNLEESSTLKCLANSNNKVQKVKIDNFFIGDAAFNNHNYLPRSFEQVNSELNISLDGVLSLSQLAKEKVVIDYRKGRLYF